MIEVEKLIKFYNGFPAVRGISFQVQQGDIYGFIGPNGAGKTTTIRILATLLEPTGGTIRVGGYDVNDHPMKVRRLIGYMPDMFGVYQRVTVWEYLDFFGAAYGLERRGRLRLLEDILELTDLSKMRDRLTGELSKGMRQRLCLAKTLVHDPKVLILDEPASGLDPRARIEFRALLRELCSMGKTILISSHILTELSDICNSVAILEKGTMVASGPIDEIKRSLQPGRVFRMDVLGEAKEAESKLREIPGVVDVKASEEKWITFAFDGDDRAVAGMVRTLVGDGVEITGLQEEKTDLETLFMRLTKGEVT